MDILRSASLLPVFFLKGTSYPKADGDNAPSGTYPIGGGYPLSYAQHGMPYKAPNISSKNDSFKVPDNFCFSNKIIRNKSNSDVYFIIMCQLLVTTILQGLTMYHKSTRMFLKENTILLFPTIFITFGVIIAFARVENLRRKSPENAILLFIFTVAESITLAIGTILYSPDKVLIGFGVATLLCFALSIFAFQTKIDVTIKVGCLLIAVIILMLIFSIAIVFPSKFLTIIIASVGAVIFSIYLIYDMQLMVGEEHKYSIASEEYVIAIITIYLDIYLGFLNMLMYILTILGSSKHN